jgi:ferrous iron transport protein A
MTLNDMKIGDSCVVTKLNDTGEIRRRIMDMGITKGTRVSVRKVAPLGDPIELSVRGYSLSLRRSDAANIEVQPA